MTIALGEAAEKKAGTKAAQKSGQAYRAKHSNQYQGKHQAALNPPSKAANDSPVKSAGGKDSARSPASKPPADSTLRLPKPPKRYRQVLALEIVVGSACILYQIEDGTTVGKILTQEAAFLLVFFILSSLTTAGPELAKFSAIFGGLIVLGIVLTRKKNAASTPQYNDGSTPIPQPSPGIPSDQIPPRPPGWQGDWPPSGVNVLPPGSV